MSSSLLTRTIYRALLQTARSLEGEPLRLRLPLHESSAQWIGRGQQYGFLPAASAARDLFPPARGYPSLPEEADAPELEAEALRGVIRKLFRDPNLSASGSDLDLGLHALKVLHGQLAMARTSSAARTEVDDGTGAAVLVEATSAYRGRDASAYVFQYRIRITNVGLVPVQVVGRQWDIRNADGSLQASVPRGSPGIVGQTPRLQPGGDCFEYASGTTLATPSGSVGGALQMMRLGAADGTGQGPPMPFDAEVGRFSCVAEEEAG